MTVPLQVNSTKPAKSIPGCLRFGNVRVGRVTGPIEGAHTVPVERVVREASIWKSSDACSYRSNLRKVGAIISCAALDTESRFVI